MRQVPLIVLALHGIHVVCMFLLLQTFCPEISNVHHGIQYICFTKTVCIELCFIRGDTCMLVSHSNILNYICLFILTYIQRLSHIIT